MTTGVLCRSALIASLYKRGVYLTGKARTEIPNAALVNHVCSLAVSHENGEGG
jgi:ATP-binding cassette, subfamily C (CFTR/MRP), member 1